MILRPDRNSPVQLGQPAILGPDGDPLQARIEIEEGALTFRDRAGLPVKVQQDQVLIDMARRERDGASLQAIMSEFGASGEARNPFLLKRALVHGHTLLEKAIAEGREPLETPPGPLLSSLTGSALVPDDEDD